MSKFMQILESSSKDTGSKVFGKMSWDSKYKTYSKTYKLDFFGKTYTVSLEIDAVDDDGTISSKQEDMFTKFEKNIRDYNNKAFRALISHIDRLGDYKDYFDNRPIPKADKEMGDIVTPKQVIINGERNLIIYCNAKWDNEHGVTIQILPSIDCGDLGKFY